MPTRRQLALGGGALVLALFLALGAFVRGELDSLREDTARRLADSEGRQQEARQLSRSDHETLLVLQARIGVLESRLAESQSQAAAIEAMYQEMVRGRDERLLAEIEQSIAIAAQQASLAGNVEAALIALQAAETRLAGSPQPRLLPLRRLVARDIERLKSTAVADLSGLSLKLDSIAATVATLPLAFEHRPADKSAADPAPADAGTAAAEPAGPLPTLWREIWRELRQLVRIERIDHGDPALLAPGQTYFLRENLRLRLLSARLALLQRDGAAYRDDLRSVRHLLEQYFDTGAKPVQSALATVTRLAAVNPAQDFPSLAETLATVRALRVPRESRS